MDLLTAIKERHSVRSFTDQKINTNLAKELQDTIKKCNQESGLRIQLCLNEPNAFTGAMARYGKFHNVKNYIALVGKKDSTLEEKSGYYGELLVLKAQQLGLHTCWVALSYSKGKGKNAINIGSDEKLLMVIALGYGVTPGVPHKMKPLEKHCPASKDLPQWFLDGVEAARLAPTAMNQQKYYFELNGGQVKATAGFGPYTKVDLGIVKYHFEVGAGSDNWRWAEN